MENVEHSVLNGTPMAHPLPPSLRSRFRKGSGKILRASKWPLWNSVFQAWQGHCTHAFTLARAASRVLCKTKPAEMQAQMRKDSRHPSPHWRATGDWRLWEGREWDFLRCGPRSCPWNRGKPCTWELSSITQGAEWILKKSAWSLGKGVGGGVEKRKDLISTHIHVCMKFLKSKCTKCNF